ncbi:MAG: glycosyltransferase [Candidatus Hodarchaeota archaeon]
MDLIGQIKIFIENLIDIILSEYFIIILFSIILLYHILCYFIRDKKYVIALKKCKDPEDIKLIDLKELPLVNILIPAWKEGKLFENCLLSITKLNYPHLKVIVNAGGNDETLRIANSFKKFEYFVILKQKPEGKMKALNDCLEHVNEGIIYSTDADVYFTDEIFLRMIYPLVNQDQYVTAGGVRPLKNQEKKDIVKYLTVNRYPYFKIKFSRLGRKEISGPNTCFKDDVIKKIGTFYDDQLFPASDRFRAQLITSKGFKIYWLSDYRSRIYTYYPNNLKTYFSQEFRWRKNAITNPYLQKKKTNIVKFLFSFLLSSYLIISPFLFLLNIYLTLIGLSILFFKYLFKIRKIINFKVTVDKTYFHKFGILFFIKMLFYLFLDAIIAISLAFNLLSYKNPNYNKN